MDFRDIVRAALDEYTEELRKAIDGLTAEERRFQPTPHSHHIDFVVWHMARVEDSWINGTAQRKDHVWIRDATLEVAGGGSGKREKHLVLGRTALARVLAAPTVVVLQLATAF